MLLNSEGKFRSTVSHAALSAGIAVSWAGLSDTAIAQQSQGITLDTITVEGEGAGSGSGDAYEGYSVPAASSPKQTAPLLDTPQTVTVVPQAVSREQGHRTLTEVLRSTPGITFDAGENGFATSTNSFKLRGFDTSGSIFVDGARDNGSFGRDTFNVERVEVFKGPAADNGRGSAGGYINLVTKTPGLENFIAGDAGISFDQYRSEPRKRGTVDFNYAFAPGAAFRMNAMVEGGGFPGVNIAEANAWGVAPSLAFGLGTPFRAIFAYEHLERRDLPYWGVPAAAVEGTIRFDPSVAANVRRDNFYGLRSDFDNIKRDSALARFEYDIVDGVTLSNQTSWSQIDRMSRFTTIATNPAIAPLPATPASTLATQTLFYDRTNTNLSNITNLSAEFHTGPFRHNLSTGVELSWEDSDANTMAGANPAPGRTNLLNPNPDRVGAAPFNVTGTSNVRVNTVAGYLYDTIHLSPQWLVTGGLRVENYNVRIQNRLLNGAPNGVNDTTSATTVGGKFGVIYKPAENGSVYASVGVSHKPPGSYLNNEDISRGGNNATPGYIPQADPVRSLNYELGTKWDFFNGRLSATAALFRSEQRVPLNPGGNIFYHNQVVQGLELGAAGYLTERWQIFGGLLFLDSKRESSAALDAALLAANPNDFRYLDNTAGPFFATSVNGDKLAFTPSFSGNLWTTYRFDNGLTVGGGLQYVGESWVGRPDDATRVIPNGVYGKLPAYFLTHLMASYELYKGVVVRFNVDNVFDEKYAVALNWPAQRATLGAPRTFRLSASFKFWPDEQPVKPVRQALYTK